VDRDTADRGGGYVNWKVVGALRVH